MSKLFMILLLSLGLSCAYAQDDEHGKGRRDKGKESAPGQLKQEIKQQIDKIEEKIEKIQEKQKQEQPKVQERQGQPERIIERRQERIQEKQEQPKVQERIQERQERPVLRERLQRQERVQEPKREFKVQEPRRIEERRRVQEPRRVKEQPRIQEPRRVERTRIDVVPQISKPSYRLGGESVWRNNWNGWHDSWYSRHNARHRGHGRVGIFIGIPIIYSFDYYPITPYPSYLVRVPPPPDYIIYEYDIWYYCPGKGYFPDVCKCRAGWLRVVPD